MNETNKGPFDITPDNYTVQSCCLAYGGNSFSGPMKKALECHLDILKTRHPEMNAAPDLLAALKAIAKKSYETYDHSVVLMEIQDIAEKAVAAAENRATIQSAGGGK